MKFVQEFPNLSFWSAYNGETKIATIITSCRDPYIRFEPNKLESPQPVGLWGYPSSIVSRVAEGAKAIIHGEHKPLVDENKHWVFEIVKDEDFLA
jgi:hypothetical protein